MQHVNEMVNDFREFISAIHSLYANRNDNTLEVNLETEKDAVQLKRELGKYHNIEVELTESDSQIVITFESGSDLQSLIHSLQFIGLSTNFY